jgi:hypothetical protein
MKKSIIIVLFLLIAGFMNAQGLSFGPQIGISKVNLIEKNSLGTVEHSFKMGYQIGVAAEFEIMSFLYVGASACFFQKGSKIEDSYGSSKLNIGYLDIPIVIGYKVPLGNVSVFGNVGPYTSVAMVGKFVYESEEFDETFDEPIEFGEMGWYKRFDSGVTFGGGVEFKQYRIKANYSLGFVDIMPSETVSAKNSVFNITATYFFGRDF